MTSTSEVTISVEMSEPGPSPDAATESPQYAVTELDKPSRLQLLLCRECFERRDRLREQAAASSEASDAEPDKEGVEALLELATDAVADERDRGRALDTKTASLAGFTGLVLSVNVTLGRPVLERDLGPVGDPLVAVCFIVSVIFLLLAMALALFGVLMPQKYRGLGREQLRLFTTPAVQSNNKLWVHRSMLGALADTLDQDRPVNDCKAKLGKHLSRMLLVGFVGVAGQALTLAAREIGL
jgi:hypothetical protein